MRMGAVGVRGEVLSPEASKGLTVAVRSDAFWVRTSSERVPGLMGSEADVTRLRLIVEGSRRFDTGGGALTPSLELGVRHDGGDAETGAGLEAGAGLRYAGASVTVEGAVRTLIAHESSGYEEWGASGAVRIDPGASGRGLSLTLAPVWGATGSGTERLWGLGDMRALAPEDEFEAGLRLEAELGYGIGVPRTRGVVTPYTGFTLGEGAGRSWRAGTWWNVAPGAVLGLEASHASGAQRTDPTRSVTLRTELRW